MSMSASTNSTAAVSEQLESHEEDLQNIHTKQSLSDIDSNDTRDEQRDEESGEESYEYGNETDEETDKEDDEGSYDNDYDDEEIFNLFPKLPIEIRLKIWRLAALHFGRIIVIKPVTQWDADDSDFWHRTSKQWHFQIPTHSTPLLIVSRESRLEMLRQYKLLTSLNKSVHSNTKPYSFRFSFALDTLCVDYENIETTICPCFSPGARLPTVDPIVTALTFQQWFGDNTAEVYRELRSFAAPIHVWDLSVWFSGGSEDLHQHNIEEISQRGIDMNAFPNLEEAMIALSDIGPEIDKTFRMEISSEKQLHDVRLTWGEVVETIRERFEESRVVAGSKVPEVRLCLGGSAQERTCIIMLGV